MALDTTTTTATHHRHHQTSCLPPVSGQKRPRSCSNLSLAWRDPPLGPSLLQKLWKPNGQRGATKPHHDHYYRPPPPPSLTTQHAPPLPPHTTTTTRCRVYNSPPPHSTFSIADLADDRCVSYGRCSALLLFVWQRAGQSQRGHEKKTSFIFLERPNQK